MPPDSPGSTRSHSPGAADPGGAQPAPPPSTGLGRRLAANTVHAASGRLAQLLVWLVFTPPILNALGPDGFAVWALFFALAGYLGSLDFGLAQGTLRHVAAARQQGSQREIGESATLAMLGFATLGILWLILGLLVRDAALAWLRISGPLNPAARLAFPVSAAIFVMAGVTSVAVSVLQGHGRFDLANRPILAFAAQQAGGFAWILARGWGLEALMWNVLTGWTIAAAIALAHLNAGAPGFRWSAPREAMRHVRSAFAFGGPMQLSNVLVAVNTQTDKFLLSRFDRLAAVSPYELGARIAMSAGTVPQLMLVALLPEASAVHAAGDTERLRALYLRGSRWMLFVTALIFAPLVGSADRLYAVWIGTPQPEAALALRVLGISAALALSTGVGTTIARGAGRTDLETWSVFVAVVLHVPAAFWLIPHLGLAGALIAFAAGTAIAVPSFLIRLGRALGWSLHDTLAPLPAPALATAAGALAASTIDRVLPAASGAAAWGTLSAVGAAGFVTALAVLALWKYVSLEEARALASQRRRA